jgi:hypothetical protein
MPNIEIPYKKKKQLKYQYTNYVTISTPLSPEYIADQKRRSLKYTKGGTKR